MLSVILGLSGAVVYGVSDFFGGLGARYLGSIRITWFSEMAGLITAVLAFFLFGGNWATQATSQTLFWGGLSGFAGTFAILFLYASLAIGPMSILSPLGALVSAIVPVAWELFTGHTLSALAYIAIAVALVAVALVGFVPEKGAVKVTARGLLFATFAGIGIGLYLICMHQTSPDSGFAPFVANRFMALTLMTVIVIVTAIINALKNRGMFAGRGPRADMVVGEQGVINWKRGLQLALVCGVFDTLGNVIILTGLHIGNMSIMAVLAALYPAGTILLATILLKERIARVQMIGLALAIIAAAMLSLA